MAIQNKNVCKHDQTLCSACYCERDARYCSNNGHCPMCGGPDDALVCDKCGRKFCWFCGDLVKDTES